MIYRHANLQRIDMLLIDMALIHENTTFPVWNPRLGAIQRTSDNYTSQRSVNFNNLINAETN